MRITRISMAGLAVALVGAAAKDAAADDLTITTATTTPVVTSNASNGSAGDVTVNSGGSITVTAGQTAVTVDSSNDVTVNSGGQLNSNDATNTAGIVIQGGNASAVNLAGTISLLENYNQTDSDGDGDLDGPVAQGTNRHGIWLQAGPTFTGNIGSTGTINIEGENSAGIRLDALLTGNLNATLGSISMLGDNSTAIAINGGAAGGVTGDVRIGGTISSRGEGARGLLVNAPIGGGLFLNGTWRTTGYNSTVRPSTQAGLDALDADDLLQSGPAIAVHYSVAGGVTVQGIGVEDDDDDDNDGTIDEADDNTTASITSLGGAPALLIAADPSAPLVLGATASGYGLHVRGSLDVNGLYNGVDTSALRLQGQAGAGVTTANGIALDRALSAVAFEADATGVHIGGFVSVPQLLNRGSIEVNSVSDTAQNASGVLVAAGANVPQLHNDGVIRAFVRGEIGTATAIADLSNTLTTIVNTGEITAQLIPTDSDLTDNVVPVATGPAIAIDLSASTVGVTINQIADPVFTDGDATDDDVNARPNTVINGEIRLGSGADAVNLLEGAINGNLSFGDGADAFVIDNGASYVGRLTDTGALTIDVQDGVMELRGGTTNITSATFGADSELRLLLSSTPGQSTTILATGAVTFAAGAVLIPLIPTGLPASGSHTFLTAGTLNGASNVTGVVSSANAPFLYNLSVAVNGVNPNALDAVFTLKTPAQLGLNDNQAAAFMPIVDALRQDDDASAAFSALAGADDFFDAYDDLMPSYSSAAAELAATAIQQQQSAASNRLAATRLQDLDEVSVWAQEIGYGLSRDPLTVNGQQYDGQGFGLAMGIDGPLDNGAIFGLSGSFITSEVEEQGRPDGEIAASFAQFNAYLGTAMGPIDLDFVAGLGAGQMNSQRFVEIGAGFREIAEGEWWAFEGHGAARASMPLRLADWFVVTPQAALTYVGLQEQSYTEEGGGAVNYDVDETFSQRLWGDVGLELSTRFQLRGEGVIAPRLYAGYRSNLIDEAAERSFRFANGGASFTLVDDAYGDGAPLVGLGIDATNGFSTFSLSYEGELGDQVERHSLNAAVRFRF